jgi:hypothetical protein
VARGRAGAVPALWGEEARAKSSSRHGSTPGPGPFSRIALAAQGATDLPHSPTSTPSAPQVRASPWTSQASRIACRAWARRLSPRAAGKSHALRNPDPGSIVGVNLRQHGGVVHGRNPGDPETHRGEPPVLERLARRWRLRGTWTTSPRTARPGPCPRRVFLSFTRPRSWRALAALNAGQLLQVTRPGLPTALRQAPAGLTVDGNSGAFALPWPNTPWACSVPGLAPALGGRGHAPRRFNKVQNLLSRHEGGGPGLGGAGRAVARLLRHWA